MHPELQRLGLENVRRLDSGQPFPIAPTGWGYVLYEQGIVILAPSEGAVGTPSVFYAGLLEQTPEWHAQVRRTGSLGLLVGNLNLPLRGRSLSPASAGLIEKAMRRGGVYGGAFVGFLAN